MEQLIGMGAPGAAAPAGNGALVKDTSTETFIDDVIEASNTTPIIVDFWAPWCGPCKQLTPILEKVVKEARGAVRLVKLNIDQNQDLAAQMRIQSIPAVYAFFRGRPVDGFVGALPESQIKAFVGRLTKTAGGAPPGPSPVEQALEQAEAALADGGAGTAAAIFEQVLAHDPESTPALAGLAKSYLAAGETAQAKEVLNRATPEQAKSSAVAAVRAALELAEQAAGAQGATAELAARLQRDPNDHQARYDLAMAAYAAGDRERAVEELLDIVKRDRSWNEDGARKQLVKLFEAFGPTDPLTVSGRRRLSSLLFR